MRTSIVSVMLLAVAVSSPVVAAIGGEISDPEPIANADTASQDWYPDIAADGHGNWMVVWQSTANLQIYGQDHDIFLARSADNGATWTRDVVNNYATTDFVDGADNDKHPRVATDGLGLWIVVWQTDADLGGTIGEDLDLLFARSTDHGATWSDAIPLNSDAATDDDNDSDAQIVTDGAGTWIVVWSSDSDILFSRSTNDGLDWSPTAPLRGRAPTDNAVDTDPEIATDGVGSWIAVWRSSGGSGHPLGADSDILFSRSSDNGVSWAYPLPLNSDAELDGDGDNYPDIATDGAGNWVAVWQWLDSDPPVDQDWEILTARSTNDGLTWTGQQILNVDATGDVEGDHSPRIVTDGRGLWIALWYTNQNSTEFDNDVYLALSEDHGATWSWPQPVNNDAAADDVSEWFPQLATSGTGHWAAVWHAQADANRDVFYVRWSYCDLALEGVDPTMIHFAPPSHVVTGRLSELRADEGFGRTVCLDSFTHSPAEDPNRDPPAGSGWYYLACGVGHCSSFGDSGLEPDPRDDLDDSDPCP